jgi:hypothetical protein
MPRNRKKRPPTAPITARGSDAGDLSCRGCGQRFPIKFFGSTARGAPVTLTEPDGSQAQSILCGVGTRVRYGEDAEAVLESMSIAAWDYRFDGSTWRPTAESRAKWAWACEVMRNRHQYSDEDVERARAGIARGGFPRDDKDRTPKPALQTTATLAQRFTLTTAIECIRYGTINHVPRPD